MNANGAPAKPLPPPGQPNKPSNPASQTLYVRNLPDKLQKTDLRRQLYMLFSTHGPVLDIVALKSKKMRGQAHVVFRDTFTSTQAMRALQGFEFFGKEMTISYATGKSDIISRLDGSAKVSDTSKPQSGTTAAATDLQKSVFAQPPGAQSTAPPAVLPAKPNLQAPANGPVDAPSPQGTKRPREDESDEEESMEEDDGEAMDVSDEE